MAKLTKAEARMALAFRLGWTQNRVSETVGYMMWKSPDEVIKRDPPDFFASRNAAAELAEWIFGHAFTDRGLCERFLQALKAQFPSTPEWYACEDFQLILSEPQQITNAACIALGLEVEE